MRTQEKTEREINLTDLFWKILFNWRKIICFSMITALLICGLKYILDNKTYLAAQDINMEQGTIVLTAEEQEQIEDGIIMIERIENYEKYLNESALMQIDPYKKPVVELQYYIESDYTYNYTQDNKNDYTGNLMSLYYNYIRSGEMSSKLIKMVNFSISQADFSELCSVAQSGSTMVVTFAWADEKKLEEISEFIKAQLVTKESEFQEVGSHKLRLLRESKNVVADIDLAEKKNTLSNNIAYINTQLTTLKANMTEEQLNLLHNGGEIEGGISKPEIPKPVPSKRYFLLGAFLGIFLICAWIACKMLFTARLQNPEEIRALYNTRLLGEVAVESKKKRFLSVIDDKLLAIKNRRKKKLSAEQQIKVIAANISLSCRQQGIENIYMTGSEYENADTATLDMLKQELVGQNIQVKEGGNIFYDADSLKQGTEIGNMIFVEQTGKSIYDEIFNELNLAREQKNQILGVVVFVC